MRQSMQLLSEEDKKKCICENKKIGKWRNQDDGNNLMNVPISYPDCHS